ncbi:tetraacyldisaccharide 4'-kinase [Robiginitalea aurantiaca]|uniref:Tetraacyldisaccharide 4'-kinase n=1 Tax=Robiginitalea aurantiaca TaxID=3056915 RepID=A0ABT7WHD8_9FLAO|nr:tetraacyldisaccharide 4'-kinase [Robiginitalea aurantiaca]MDM9632338.1 tetraacyldisaccharide 4'-kinase [Robiginitalea aurantiaca]
MKWLRNLGLPFSLLYGWIVWFRNKCYDWGWFASREYEVPILCIGNLSTGGSGKTPMAEWILARMLPKKRVAVLSRGYKRETEGFLVVTPERTAAEVGDEPLQMGRKFPDAVIAVDANRQRGIEKLVDMVDPELIILDDGFQHRKVTPARAVLLTAYDELYTEEAYLPAGNLRDHRSQAKRADLIVVTKCPSPISEVDRDRIRRKLAPKMGQRLAFASLCYQKVIDRGGKPLPDETLRNQKFTLVTGIARPEPLIAYLKQSGVRFEHLRYPDHHRFTASELKMLKGRLPILTTEKDGVRLEGAIDEFYVIPVHHCFSPGDAKIMEEFLSEF